MNIDQVRLLIEARKGTVEFDSEVPRTDRAMLEALRDEGYVSDFNLVECGSVAEVNLLPKGKAFLESLCSVPEDQRAVEVAGELLAALVAWLEAEPEAGFIGDVVRRQGSRFVMLTTVGEFEVTVRELR